MQTEQDNTFTRSADHQELAGGTLPNPKYINYSFNAQWIFVLPHSFKIKVIDSEY